MSKMQAKTVQLYDQVAEALQAQAMTIPDMAQRLGVGEWRIKSLLRYYPQDFETCGRRNNYKLWRLAL